MPRRAAPPISLPVLRRLSAALAALALPPLALAAPSGGEVVLGSATISRSGTATTIDQSSARAVIDWRSFGIASGEQVNFVQPDRSAIALNRVIGNERSVIDGVLRANGQVFLVNSNGVLFGAGSSVSAAGIVASTLDISNTDFIAGRQVFAGGGGAVENDGRISVPEGGYVALLGGAVRNGGGIEAPKGMAALAAGNRVTLTFAGDSLLGLSLDAGGLAALVENGGAIVADGGRILLTARGADELAGAQVNTTGLLRARTIDDLKGGIVVLAEGGGAHVAGTLDASAPAVGDGGFIETSGRKVGFADDVVITTAAASGRTGRLLIDPDGFTIGSGGDIGAGLLSTLLASNDIDIESTMGSGSDGNLRVNEAVSWSAGTRLGLKATHDILVNAPITATGAGAGLTLDYGGDYKLAGGASVTLSGAGASLAINGTQYQLVHGLAELAALDDNDEYAANGHYALAQDIDASGATHPTSVLGTLGGTLAGMGHTVDGLRIVADDLVNYAYGVGLVGIASNGSVIRDIGVTNADVTGYSWVGALVGMNRGSVSNAWASGQVTGNYVTGGLVGFNLGSIAASHSSASVTGGTLDPGFGSIGGLVGRSTNGTISDSWASGKVTVVSSNVNVSAMAIGGLVGDVIRGSIVDSHATGDVTVPVQTNAAGGLVGMLSYASISGSYATGDVTGGGWYLGGLVAQMYGAASISDSWASGDVVSSNLLSLHSFGGYGRAGGLVGATSAESSVTGSHATGMVSGLADALGGLVGENYGAITGSYATGAVIGNPGSATGGLAGANYEGGSITGSHATGDVTGGLYAGGLAGSNAGRIADSYASGNVNGKLAGGLAGLNLGVIDGSNATGSVTSEDGTGGLVGSNSFTSNSVEYTGTITDSSYRDVAAEHAEQLRQEEAARERQVLRQRGDAAGAAAGSIQRETARASAQAASAASAPSAMPQRAPALTEMLTVLERSRYSAGVRSIELDEGGERKAQEGAAR
ncbi:GLUG motif-containing protein [Derxia gummosa]|uniref:GLUG motif-containing protein n=1 Tax=Derxia gummosa DSM 723 TaxID=1121388 RepID=A0A8B6X8E7_9BURK|nr:GLUG motif-containing protein [Derxia gummosa]